jgi:hypothetical protein
MVSLQSECFDKHTTLQRDPYITDTGCFTVQALGLYSQHFIFFVTYEWANKLECLGVRLGAYPVVEYLKGASLR